MGLGLLFDFGVLDGRKDGWMDGRKEGGKQRCFDAMYLCLGGL